ncbi:MAG: glycosyltransferase [Phycisphaerales bacterium]|nr:glycosyltransferase [Phycisphaerales bacterium]MCB9856505.1 glycosyltransferase [Phycisphaerales bacterium]MCB9863986.1 glycosyltransferase [Phycisphaerales bacterium]
MTATTTANQVLDSATTEKSHSTSARELVNVLLLTSSLERGGAERQVVELAKSLDPTVFRVHVCSLSNDNPLADQLGPVRERFEVIEKRSKYDVALIRRVSRYMKTHRIDVVHSFMFDAEIVGRLAGRIAGVPAVICSNRCPHWQRSRFKLFVARITAGCFDRMIANSHAGMLFERDQQRVPTHKLCVIPNGVDTNRFKPRNADALRDSLGVSREAVVVGMIAHFRGNKDHDTWLRAAAEVLKTHPHTIFVSAGAPDGDTNDHCFGRATRLCRDLGIEDVVRFLGPRDDVAELYSMFDMKVLSSRFEGTPNVVLEAMAAGVPTIVTDVSDNARIVEDGRTGFVVPMGDAKQMAQRMSELVGNATLRRQMGEAARARAMDEYSVEALGRRTADVYLDVLRSKGAVDFTATVRTGEAE